MEIESTFGLVTKGEIGFEPVNVEYKVKEIQANPLKMHMSMTTLVEVTTAQFCGDKVPSSH